MRRATVLGLLTLLHLARAGDASEQDKPKAPATPQFGSEVTLVTVPVFVTDSASRAVGGLVAGDFQVEDEGRSVPVTGFLEVDAGKPPTSVGSFLASSARRYFLLFIDLSFSSPQGVVQSRKAALEFVEKDLAPSDLCAVATFSTSSGVKLLVGFTSDRRALAQAVNGLDLQRLERKADPLLLTYDLPAEGVPLGGASSPGGEATGRGFDLEDIRAMQVTYRQLEQDQYKRKVGILLEGMVQLARTLDGIQGRKQVIYLSGGFNDATLAGAEGTEARRNAQAVTEGRIWEVTSDSQFGDASLRQQLQKTLQVFAGTDSVVHTVDVTGFAGASGNIENQVGVDTRGSGGRQSLSQMAAATGGRFIKDTNDVGAALAEILESSRRYYLLAFEPTGHKGAGRFHKVKVKVRGKGLKVSHRSGYLEALPFASRAPLTRTLEAAQTIASGVSGGSIGVQALAVPYLAEDGEPLLATVLEIDGPSLLDRAPSDKLPLEVFGYALDGEGRVEDVFHQTLDLDLTKAGGRLRQTGLQVHSTFALPVGAHSLRFLVRDGASGRAGAYRSETEVPAFGPESVVVATPLLIEDPGGWIVVSARGRSGTAEPSPFHIGKDLFVPRARATLVPGEARELCVLVYDANSEGEAVSFEVQAQLLDSAGTVVPLGEVEILRAIPDRGGLRRILLRAKPGPQAPGDYTIRVEYKDSDRGRAGEALLPVRFSN